MRRKSRMIDDCLVLLDYVSKHPDENQTYDSLSLSTGIPRETLKKIICFGRRRYDSMLARTATKYRFDFEVFGGASVRFQKRIIWVDYRGF